MVPGGPRWRPGGTTLWAQLADGPVASSRALAMFRHRALALMAARPSSGNVRACSLLTWPGRRFGLTWPPVRGIGSRA